MPTKRQRKIKAIQRVNEESELQYGEVAGYIRVSTEEQAESGLGIGDQIQKVKAQAEVKGWPEPVFYMDDGVSGTIHPSNRNQMKILLKDIEEKRIKAVIVSALDRVGRTIDGILFVTKEFQYNGITFVSSKETLDSSTAAGRLGMHLLMILAEFERDNTSERTVAALAEKYRRDGDAGGRLPYGYKRVFGVIETVKGTFSKTVDVEIDEDRAKVVRLIFALRSQPKDEMRPWGPRMTLQSICEHVNKIAPTGAYGGKWTPTRVKDILGHEDCYRGGFRGDSALRWPAIIQ